MNYSKKNVVNKHKELISTNRKVTNKMLISIFKLLVFLLVLGVAAVGFLGLGMVKGIIDGAPDIENVNIAPVSKLTTIVDTDGNVVEKLITDGSNRVPVAITDMPAHLQNAFIAIEDERFLSHNGIDVKGILRAGVVFLTTMDASQGASTITQQLLKNNVFEDGGYESNYGALIKRKIQEQYLAMELEKVVNKDIILENYLNTISLGAGTYGVQAAATKYFGKDVKDLTISESAVLAATTKAPYTINPIANPEANAERREHVLNNMYDLGFITKAEYDEALADDVYARVQNNTAANDDSSPYSYFTDALIRQVLKDLMNEKGYTEAQATNALYSGGLTIYTTQDSQMQEIADRVLSDPASYPADSKYSVEWKFSVLTTEVDEYGDRKQQHYSHHDILYYHRVLLENSSFRLLFNTEEEAKACVEEYKAYILKEGEEVVAETFTTTIQPQASMTIIDQKTGFVKAIVGGRGDKTASLSLNRATDSTRQPGSLFKVLAAFGPAIDRCNYTIASVFDDAPYAYSSGQEVKNWWGQTYRGLSSIREGIKESMNIVAVKCLAEITPAVGFEYLKSFGFTTLVESQENGNGGYDTDITESLSLGGLTNGVTNLEMCAAYACIANSGTYIEPTLYTKIVDSNGRTIIDKNPSSHQVIKETTAFLLTDAMHDCATSGTGYSANIWEQYTAIKTGTTSNEYDIWTAGFTPYLTAVVWSGYDENTKLTSTDYRNVIWRDVMSEINTVKGYTRRDFKVPDDIETVEICSKCGLLAVDGICDNVSKYGTNETESFIREEYFAKDSVPEEVCVCHAKYTLCSASNKLASEDCPESLKVEKVFLYRFQGDEGTTNDTPYELPDSVEGTECPLH